MVALTTAIFMVVTATPASASAPQSSSLVASTGLLFPDLVDADGVNTIVASLGSEAALLDLSFSPWSLAHQVIVEAPFDQEPSEDVQALFSSSCDAIAETYPDNSVSCSVAVHRGGEEDDSAPWILDLAVECETEFVQDGSASAGSSIAPLDTHQSTILDAIRASVGKDSFSDWDRANVDASTFLEGALYGSDSAMFLALHELGEAEPRLHDAVGGHATEIVVIVEEETDAAAAAAAASAGAAGDTKRSDGRPQPYGGNRGHESSSRRSARAVEKVSAPVYSDMRRILPAADPYCNDPYADPYNPYCATCQLGDLEDSLPEGYVVVSAETNRYHPDGRVLDQGESAVVSCADGYTNVSTPLEREVTCGLSAGSNGNGFEDRSSPFVFVAFPADGAGGLTCYDIDDLPMQECDTNSVLGQRNFKTPTPGLIAIDANITVSCQAGFTDPSSADNTGTLGCEPRVNASAAWGQSDLTCSDIDELCLVAPEQCTQVGDTGISFEECDTMLDGGALTEDFNAAFLAFLQSFLGTTLDVVPELSPTCGSIFLNMYFDDPADQAAFRALIEQALAGNQSTIDFEFQGQTMSFSLQDLVLLTTEVPTTGGTPSMASSTAGETTAVPQTTASAIVTTESPTTEVATTEAPSTAGETTVAPQTTAATIATTETPTTETPTTGSETTADSPTTGSETTVAPHTTAQTIATTASPTTVADTTESPRTTAGPTTDGPSTAEPTTEAPTTNAASTNAPSTDAPSTDGPSTDGPSTDSPSTDGPSTAAPSTDAPSTAAPSTGSPSTDAPSTDGPSTDALSTDAPSTEAPSTGAPSTDGSSTDGSSTDGSTAGPTPPVTTDAPTTSATTSPDLSVTEAPVLEDWEIGLIVVFLVLIVVAIIVIVILAAQGRFNKKEPKEDEAEEDVDEEEEDQEDEDEDDGNDSDFAMRTAAAQALVGEIVTSQVPDASEAELSEHSTTDSELAPGNDVTSTGAAELISSIISAIDDVDVNDADVGTTTETGGDEDEPVPTTDATKALINEVLSDAGGDQSFTDPSGSTTHDDDGTVSVSGTEGTTITTDGISRVSPDDTQSTGPRDEAYE